MIRIGARWPSTWPVPTWESSSTTKIAESFQCSLCETSSTILPVRHVEVDPVECGHVAE